MKNDLQLRLFKFSVEIALKEMRETNYWIRIIIEILKETRCALISGVFIKRQFE